MKKIDNTILNSKQINDYAQDKIADHEDQADEAEDYDDPDGADSENMLSQEWHSFATDNQNLHFKSYKVGIDDAFDKYQKLPRSVSNQDLKDTVFNTSKQTYQQKVKQEQKRQAKLHAKAEQSRKEIKTLTKKSLSHTYRASYLKKVFKDGVGKDYVEGQGNTLNYDDMYSKFDDLNFDQHNIDKTFKGQKVDTKYVHNYLLDHINQNLDDSFPKHTYMTVKDFKDFAKHMDVDSRGRMQSNFSPESPKIIDRPCGQKSLNEAKNQYGYMNTEPLDKLKKQLQHQTALQKNKAILTPNQISKQGMNGVHKIANEFDNVCRTKDELGIEQSEDTYNSYNNYSNKWEHLADLAKGSQYTKHPLYLYKNNLYPTVKTLSSFVDKETHKYHAGSFVGLTENPKFRQDFVGMKQQLHINSKINYLQKNNPKQAKALLHKMFTPNQIKYYHEKCNKFSKNMDKASYLIDGKNNVNSTANLARVYGDDIVAKDNGAEINGVPYQKDIDNLKRDGKALDKSVEKWLPLIDKDDRKMITKSKDTFDYSQYANDNATSNIDYVGNNLSNIKANKLSQFHDEFYKKGIRQLNQNKIKNLINPKKHKFMVQKRHQPQAKVKKITKQTRRTPTKQIHRNQGLER